MTVAKSPFGDIISTGLMMYFVGNSIQIFSILMLALSFVKPISRIMELNSVFTRYSSPRISLLTPKIIYIVLNICVLGICLWKANKMGFVPTLREIQGMPDIPEVVDYFINSF